MGSCAHWNLKDPTITKKIFKCAFQIHINIPQCTLRGISVSFFRNSSPSSLFQGSERREKGSHNGSKNRELSRLFCKIEIYLRRIFAIKSYVQDLIYMYFKNIKLYIYIYITFMDRYIF
jgi:hypothetical protein